MIDAVKENRLIEAFGAGTAAVVSPVQGFHYRGTDYEVCWANELMPTLQSLFIICCFQRDTLFVIIFLSLLEYVQVPLNKNDSKAKAGVLTQRVWDTITDIQVCPSLFTFNVNIL